MNFDNYNFPTTDGGRSTGLIRSVVKPRVFVWNRKGGEGFAKHDYDVRDTVSSAFLVLLRVKERKLDKLKAIRLAWGTWKQNS